MIFSSIVVSISACQAIGKSRETGVQFPAGELFFLFFCASFFLLQWVGVELLTFFDAH
jgi:hypothetical protein